MHLSSCHPVNKEDSPSVVPTTKHMLVRDGDKVEAGEQLCDGDRNPSDILAIRKSCLVNNLPLGNVCLKRILHVRLACYALDTLRKAEKSSQSQVERLQC